MKEYTTECDRCGDWHKTTVPHYCVDCREKLKLLKEQKLEGGIENGISLCEE